jgi:hypothetical protein
MSNRSPSWGKAAGLVTADGKVGTFSAGQQEMKKEYDGEEVSWSPFLLVPTSPHCPEHWERHILGRLAVTSLGQAQNNPLLVGIPPSKHQGTAIPPDSLETRKEV